MSMIATPSERDKEIVRLRTDEKLFLHEIGNRYGLSKERVRQIVKMAQYKAHRPPHWRYGLSTRLRNVLFSVNDIWLDMPEAKAARGVASFSEPFWRRQPNLGHKMLVELKQWLARFGYRLPQELSDAEIDRLRWPCGKR